MITSSANPQVKRILQLNQKAKLRREEGVFPAEGLKMFLEAPPEMVEKVYLAESLSVDERLWEKLRNEGLDFEIVADSIFERMSDTRTPQGILTLLRTPAWRMEDILQKENPLILVLEDLQDPGNAGTIIRTAEGAGVDGVFLTRGSVDITNPKVIRATMGSIYRVPAVYSESLGELLETLHGRGIRSFAAHLKGSLDYDQAEYTHGTALLIGNEANGLSEEASRAAGQLIRIPMQGALESLNAAMAAGILMYEAARQRRHAAPAKQGGMTE